MKIVALTQCFIKSELLEHFMPKVAKYSTCIDEHWVTLNHYPVDEQANCDRLRQIGESYGCHIWDNIFDRGLHKAFNNWFGSNYPGDDSAILGLDADTNFFAPGYDAAMKDVMEFDPAVTICAMRNPGTELKIAQGLLHPQVQATPNGTRYFIHPGLEMFDVSLWRSAWVKAIGGFNEPFEYYGGLESWLFMQPGFKLAYVFDHVQAPPDFPENCRDPRYTEWKHAHLGGYKKSFKVWLSENVPSAI